MLGVVSYGDLRPEVKKNRPWAYIGRIRRRRRRRRSKIEQYREIMKILYKYVGNFEASQFTKFPIFGCYETFSRTAFVITKFNKFLKLQT